MKRFAGRPDRNKVFQKALFIVLVFISALLLQACGGESTTPETGQETGTEKELEPLRIAVFIPGVLAGSPLYQMLADGVTDAAEEFPHVTVKIVEGGFNQAEWQDKVTELASTGMYDLIISSNPALPDICNRVSSSFPDQKFLLFDGYLEGNSSMYTFRYNQYEQAFLAGHMAGLVTGSSMEGVNDEAIIGLIAGQEYPDMNDAIRPGFLAGARSVDPEIKLDFRVVGNWYDATKASELSRSMIQSGVDVILPIAGGANQGVIKAAEEEGIYIHWFDTNGYRNSPGRIIGSTAILQEKAAYENTLRAIRGTLPYGQADIVGVSDGWIHFIHEDSAFEQTVPEQLRTRQLELLEKMEKGEIRFPMPR